VLNYIESNKLVSMEKEIFPQVIQNTGRFFGYKFKGHWIDVGRISSYISVHLHLLEAQRKMYITGKQCSIHGELKHSCVGSMVAIGKNTVIESSVVFDNVTVGEDVILDHCVIGEHVQIGDGSILRNVAIGDNEQIEAQTTQDNVIIWNQPIPEGYPDKQIGNVIGE
jgi:NDP-sugar pyrophosphorylase family protein